MSAPFTGTTNDDTRNKAQENLFKSIGNDSTRPRSIELAIRLEAALYNRCGKRPDHQTYKTKYRQFIDKLKDKQDGFDLNRRLLSGELAPEKWVEDEIPEAIPELVKKGEEIKSASPAPAPPSSSSPAPGPAPAAAKPATTTKDGDKEDTTEEGAAAKSKYYFFSSTPKEEAHKYNPKPIDATQVEAIRPVVPEGVSSWNAAGTWEEKDLSKKSRQRLKELLVGMEVPPFPEGKATINDSAWSVEGEANMVVVRNKRRVGFEMAIKTTFKGEYKGEGVEGDISIPSLDDTDGPSGDYEISITAKKNNEAHEVVRRAVKKTEEALKARIKKWIEEMKALQ